MRLPFIPPRCFSPQSLTLFCFVLFCFSAFSRKGGGDGDDDIRKLAYFSAFIDPALLKGPRDKTRVVRYKVPPKTAMQISDPILKTSRYVFGPELAILLPHEEFMVFSLSGEPLLYLMTFVKMSLDLIFISFQRESPRGQML